MKGSKRDRWLKDGIKTSKKHFKRLWNRKVRHTSTNFDTKSSYKKLAGESIYIYVP